ncbi:MAG: DNA polymerase III subunit beta [Clostridia bacterium]|nr:DNA polymerase III subunit beta [Clostridia bacterium]
MKISVERHILSEVITHLSRVASPKSSLPVLEGIFVSAENNMLTLISYNLEMGMKKQIPAKVYEEGKIVISARIFGEIVRKMVEPFVDITVDDRNMCHFESGKTVFDIMGSSAEDYPQVPEINQNKGIKLPASLFKNMVNQTIFSVAGENTQKPILKGSLFEIDPAYITVVSVDGFRMSIRKEKLESGLNENVVIPGRLLSEIVRIINEESENIEIYISQNHIMVRAEEYDIISRLLEGEFINYKNSIPQNFHSTILIKTKEMIDVIERISLLISEQIKTPIRCIIEKEKMIFSCASALGRGTDSCDIELNGEEFEIGFNSRFLLEALKAIEDEEVVLNFNGPFSPMLIQPVENDAFSYMIMPMRLNTEVK